MSRERKFAEKLMAQMGERASVHAPLQERSQEPVTERKRRKEKRFQDEYTKRTVWIHNDLLELWESVDYGEKYKLLNRALEKELRKMGKDSTKS